MSLKVTRLTFLAQVISKITNPCILSVLMLLLIALTKSSNTSELVIWGVIILVFFVFIPLVYLYFTMSTTGNRIKSVFELTLFLKQHPGIIFILAISLGLPCLLMLWFLKAPAILISTLVTLILTSIIIALFYRFYRVSFHLAAVTLLAIIAAQVWGQIFFILLVVIPPIAWAKYYVHDHTIPQLLNGITIAVVVGLITLRLLS